MTEKLWMIGLGLLLATATVLMANPMPAPREVSLPWSIAEYHGPGTHFVFRLDLKDLLLRFGVYFLIILGLGYYTGRILHRVLLTDQPHPWNKPGPCRVV